MPTIYITQPIEEDGYYEVHLSLIAGMTPLMKCRAVKTLNGTYKSVVRDFNSGVLISESSSIFMKMEDALTAAVSFAIEFLKGCIK